MRILVIEDNKDILTGIIDYLSIKNHNVDCAQDGITGLHMAVTGNFDIIVLDVMLPGIDGYQLCHRLRESKIATPIIMLTAKDTLEDRITGLKLGADDYLIKPFAASELMARIESIVRRTLGINKRILQVEDLTFDLDTYHVHRNGKPLKINPTGKRILELLMLKSPAIVKREYIETELWGEALPESDSLRTHMHQLRIVVDKPFAKDLLHTIRGVGYYISASHDF